MSNAHIGGCLLVPVNSSIQDVTPPVKEEKWYNRHDCKQKIISCNTCSQCIISHDSLMKYDPYYIGWCVIFKVYQLPFIDNIKTVDLYIYSCFTLSSFHYCETFHKLPQSANEIFPNFLKLSDQFCHYLTVSYLISIYHCRDCLPCICIPCSIPHKCQLLVILPSSSA